MLSCIVNKNHNTATEKRVQDSLQCTYCDANRLEHASMILIMMIMIVLTGAFGDFYNLLAAPRTVSCTYAQMTGARSYVNHVQHIERLSRGAKRHLSY